jgi:hypothetical protein
LLSSRLFAPGFEVSEVPKTVLQARERSAGKQLGYTSPCDYSYAYSTLKPEQIRGAFAFARVEQSNSRIDTLLIQIKPKRALFARPAGRDPATS